jgi:hypothetical protein
VYKGRHTGNAGRDDDEVGILKGSLGAIVGREVTGGFLLQGVSANYPFFFSPVFF